MKKLLSIVMVVSLLLTCIPLSVSAVTTTEYDELIALGCEVFPEYSTALRADVPENSTYSRTSLQREIVATETRTVSDKQELTLTQYSDGLVVLGASDYCDDTITVTGSSSGSGGKTVTVKLTVVCNYSSSVFIATGVRYTSVSQGFDVINSTGSLSSSTATASISGYNLNETSSSSPAYVNYWIHFTNSGGTPFEVTYKFCVGNEGCWGVIY